MPLQTLKLVKSCDGQHDFYNFLDAVMTICFYWIEITDMPNDKNKKLVYYHINEKLNLILFYLFWQLIMSAIFIQKITTKTRLTRQWNVINQIDTIEKLYTKLK